MFRIKNSKVRMVWLLSYLSVVMLPIIISLMSYSIYFNNFKKQNDAFNTYVSDFTTNHIRDVMTDMRRVYADVTSHDKLLPVLRITDPSEYLKNKNTVEFLSYIERAAVYRNENTTFFLYIPETDTVLSPIGAVESRNYFDACFGGDGKAFAAWKNTLELSSTGFFFNEIKSIKNKKTFIEYCAVMPRSIRQYGYNAVFCAMTEKSMFFQKIEEVEWTKATSIYIFNSRDELILDSTDNPDTPQTLHDLLETVADDCAVLSKHIDFDTAVLNIVLVTGKDNLLLQVLSMRKLFLVSTCICIIFSLLLAVAAVRRNYRPINEILTTIGDKSAKDEFAEIKQYVKRSQLKESKQQEAVKQDYLLHLVKGTFPRHYQWEALEKSGIVFSKRAFLILVISVKDLESYAESSHESLQKRFNELCFMMTNVYEELYSNENTKSYVINIENHFVCIINTDLSYDNNLQTLLQLADLGASMFNREYKLELQFALSKVHTSVRELPEAYKEALQELNIQKIKKMNYYPSDTEKENSYYFDLDTEQKLLHCIRTGDRAAAETIINDMFHFLENSGSFNPVYARCLFMDAAFTLLKVSKPEEQSISYILQDNLTLQQMYEWLIARIQFCCIENESADEKSIDSVLEYVYQNYRSEELNVAFLSEHFGLSPYYLSKRFKDTFGESLIDFIHKLRLVEAKELIRSGNRTMADISQQVGYANIRTFNRVFKKYEGMTPMQYRQQG